MQEQERTIKRNFVNTELRYLLFRLNEDILKVEYVIATPSENEYVIITYKTGYQKKICVTADSLKAIVIDVLRNSI